MKKIIIIVVAVLVLGGGGFFAWTLLSDKPDAEADVEKEVEAVDPLELVESQVHMESITTNLRSPNNYIVIALSTQLSDADAKGEFEARLPEMKSVAISTFNTMDKKTLANGEGTKKLTESLKLKFNERMTSGEVTDIYVTDFKLQ